jgi:indole-3-glycerol phosphate synthase
MTDKLQEICGRQAHRSGPRASVAASLSGSRCAAPQPDCPAWFSRPRSCGEVGDWLRLIAEIKKASPSKGLDTRKLPSSRTCARLPGGRRRRASRGAYRRALISRATRIYPHRPPAAACDLPVLRKALHGGSLASGREARAIDADAILIIVAALADTEMQEIEAAAARTRDGCAGCKFITNWKSRRAERLKSSALLVSTNSRPQALRWTGHRQSQRAARTPEARRYDTGQREWHKQPRRPRSPLRLSARGHFSSARA